MYVVYSRIPQRIRKKSNRCLSANGVLCNLQVMQWLQSLLPNGNSRLHGRKDYALYLLPPSNRSVITPILVGGNFWPNVQIGSGLVG